MYFLNKKLEEKKETSSDEDIKNEYDLLTHVDHFYQNHFS